MFAKICDTIAYLLHFLQNLNPTNCVLLFRVSFRENSVVNYSACGFAAALRSDQLSRFRIQHPSHAPVIRIDEGSRILLTWPLEPGYELNDPSF